MKQLHPVISNLFLITFTKIANKWGAWLLSFSLQGSDKRHKVKVGIQCPGLSGQQGQAL